MTYPNRHLVSFKFISYFNSHFYTLIVIVTYEPFAFTPSERGKYSQESLSENRKRSCQEKTDYVMYHGYKSYTKESHEFHISILKP